MNYKYEAMTTAPHPINRVVTLKASTYDRLSDKIRKEMADIRCYTQGVNGGMNPSESEPYTKNLIYPEVKWSITREEHDN